MYLCLLTTKSIQTTKSLAFTKFLVDLIDKHFIDDLLIVRILLLPHLPPTKILPDFYSTSPTDL